MSIAHDVHIVAGIIVESDILGLGEMFPCVGPPSHFSASNLQYSQPVLVSNLIEIIMPILVGYEVGQWYVSCEEHSIEPRSASRNQTERCGADFLESPIHF